MVAPHPLQVTVGGVDGGVAGLSPPGGACSPSTGGLGLVADASLCLLRQKRNAEAATTATVAITMYS